MFGKNFFQDPQQRIWTILKSLCTKDIMDVARSQQGSVEFLKGSLCSKYVWACLVLFANFLFFKWVFCVLNAIIFEAFWHNWCCTVVSSKLQVHIDSFHIFIHRRMILPSAFHILCVASFKALSNIPTCKDSTRQTPIWHSQRNWRRFSFVSSILKGKTARSKRLFISWTQQYRSPSSEVWNYSCRGRENVSTWSWLGQWMCENSRRPKYCHCACIFHQLMPREKLTLSLLHQSQILEAYTLVFSLWISLTKRFCQFCC